MEDNGFYEEIKSEFDRETEIKSRLDTKSSNMMTASATVAVLIGGFASIVLSGIPSASQHFYVILTFFFLSVSLSIASLCIAIWSYMRKEYEYPFKITDFRAEGKLTDEFREKRNYSGKAFKNYMLQLYLKCLEKNRPINQRKTELINYSQWLLVAALVLLPFLLVVIGIQGLNITLEGTS